MERKKMTVIIPIKAVSWNEIATAHWRKVRDIFLWLKCETRNVLLEMPKAEKIKFTKRVCIYVEARWKGNRRHDSDNICVKPILDTFVKEEVLVDDSMEYIRSVEYTGTNGTERDELRIILFEVADPKPLE